MSNKAKKKTKTKTVNSGRLTKGGEPTREQFRKWWMSATTKLDAIRDVCEVVDDSFLTSNSTTRLINIIRAIVEGE